MLSNEVLEFLLNELAEKHLELKKELVFAPNSFPSQCNIKH